MVQRFLERRASSRTSALRDSAIVAGTIASIWLLILYWGLMVKLLGNDGLVYWAVNPADPYVGSTVGGEGAYLYSPAFTLAFTPFRLLPREVFFVVWTGLIVLAALWLAKPWPLMLLPLALPVIQDAMIGNIHILLGAAIVLGFRWPATWAFVLLSKVTPGVGLLWFLVRREWRSLAIALGVTVAIAAASYALAPQQWVDWIALLRHDGGQESTGLLIRLACAAALVAWGGLTSRAWTVPIAAMLALPVIWQLVRDAPRRGLAQGATADPRTVQRRKRRSLPHRRWAEPAPAHAAGGGRAAARPGYRLRPSPMTAKHQILHENLRSGRSPGPRRGWNRSRGADPCPAGITLIPAPYLVAI